MKKFTSFIIALATFAIDCIAQPMHYNTNVPVGNNAIPFNSGAQMQWRRAQFCIPAGSLGGVAAGNNITTIYFMAASGANITYPNLYVRLKTGTTSGLTGTANGPFESGMTQVFHATNYVMTATASQWVGITLNTPFLYDPSLPLYVDFEHDHPSAAGPGVCQSGSFAGPGNGRQYGFNNGGLISGTGGQQLTFGIDVIPATPCSAAPATHSLNISSYTTCPSIPNPTLALANSYSLGGLTYQWMASSTSQVGPFTNVPSATLSSINVPTLSTTTWYQLVVTCTNVPNATTTLATTEIYVNTANTQNTVPYYESFEDIQFNNRLPNCSWYATDIGGTVKTYMSAGSNNLLPRTGNKFASFNNSTPGTNYYYTNQIWMEAGVTYSASMWYQTDLSGATNWSNLAMLVGSSQSAAGLTQIAGASPAVSPVYKPLSNLFTVPTSGYYHIAIRATGAAGNAQNLSWDDLSVTIPCEAATNSPTVTLSQSSATICQGVPVSVTAAGATTYSWSDGSAGSQLNDTPNSSTVYTVTGTNGLSGCTATAVVNVKVNPSPVVHVVSIPAAVCKGKPVSLMASGAASYAWSNGGFGAVVTAVPSTTTMYTVIGTGTNNCTGTSFVSVNVLNLPNVTASSSALQICAGEPVSLSANGAIAYQWVSSNSPNVLQGTPVTILPSTSGAYSVTGTDQAGCENTAMVSLNVEACTAIAQNEATGSVILVYPNPATGNLSISAQSGSILNFSITDMTGRIVLQQDAHGASATTDITRLSAGVYFVNIESTYGHETVRIIKD